MTPNISINVGLFLIFLFLFTAMQSAGAVTKSEVEELRAKASVAQQKLKRAIEDGKDVSAVVPMLKRVKQLGDEKRFQETGILLDKIRCEFEKLYDPLQLKNQPIAKAKSGFSKPRKVNLIGYNKSVMEPFITRDGRYLFFNSHDADNPKTNKDIYYAQRLDDLHFRFMGEIKGINSAAVDGVPTMDRYGNFYYVSTVHYGKKNGFATVYSGQFSQGEVRAIRSHPELSLKTPGWLNMDIEISADGNRLYATQTYFGSGPPPKKSYLFVAHREGDRFLIDKRSDSLFRRINTDDLEYAASLSTDELEIFFTRLTFEGGARFTSYRATRTNKYGAFSEPVRIRAITGIAEAPAITNDGRVLYYHKKEGRHFRLYALERTVQ